MQCLQAASADSAAHPTALHHEAQLEAVPPFARQAACPGPSPQQLDCLVCIRLWAAFFSRTELHVLLKIGSG